MSQAPTTQAAVLTNEQRAKEDAFKELREIGRSEGKGKTARLRAAEYITARAKEGLFVEADNKRAWSEIIQGAGEELLDVGGNDVRETQQFKQRASDIKHFIVLGQNKAIDGPAVLAKARERMKELRSSGKTKSARIWELMLSFARNQNAQPKTPLADKDIDKVMADKATIVKRKAIAEKLWEVRERLVKLNEGYDYPDVYKACELIEERVKDLGGTKKQKLAAKEEAKKAGQPAPGKRRKKPAKAPPPPATSEHSS